MTLKAETLTARIWRRGRGIICWRFTYIERSTSSWFTTPGWYRRVRTGRMYRLTIDHDYPEKPIWLGYRNGRKWVNAEGLYEVLLVTHPLFAISSRTFRGAPNRSLDRRVISKIFLEAETACLIRSAAYPHGASDAY